MANPTQPCPYCGAANLTAAQTCGTCGRPLAATPPAPGGGPAKTMFGYAAPMVRPNAPPAPAPQYQPPVDQGAPTIVQNAQPDPTEYAPPVQPQYAQPQYAPPPAQPQYAPPPAQPQYAPPPAQPQYAPPPAAQPEYSSLPTMAPQYMPPAAQAPYVPPAQPQYAPPPAQAQYAPPVQPQYAAAPPAQPPPPVQPPTPGYLAPSPHDPLGNLASHVPQSAPGTLFGFPIARLREPALQRRVLFLAGVALAISAVVPFALKPMVFPWSGNAFYGFIWPILAAASYLLVAAAPPDLRQKVPPAVLHWLPFSVAFLGTFFSGLGISAMFGGFGGGLLAAAFGGGGYFLGFTLLCFGLLSRLARPDDQIARIIIAVGGGLLAPSFFELLGHLHFHGGIFEILMQLLMLVVLALGVCCIVYVVPPKHLPPALKMVDALAPLVTAVLLSWIPVQLIMIALGVMSGFGGGFVTMLLMLAHGLLAALAYFGVLMMTAPAAYEEAMALVHKMNAGGPPPAHPPAQ